MLFENPVSWLSRVSKICREMSAVALAGYLETPEDQEGEIFAVKTVLTSYFNELKELIPSNLQKTRIGDLERHISFSHRHDFLDIINYDIPDILEKCEDYALENQLPSLGELSWYIHKSYKAKVEIALNESESDYHSLVNKCCIIFFDLLSDKTNLEDIGFNVIGQIFKPENPILEVQTRFKGRNKTNLQKGLMLLTQGAWSFIRCPASHTQMRYSKRAAINQIIVLSLLTSTLEGCNLRSN